jgi:GNAT superfamily N-acetyltransferase
MAAEIERIRAFQDSMDESVVDMVEPWPFGTALLSPTIGTVWDANYCRLEGTGADAAMIGAAAEATCRDAGLAHAAVVTSDESEAARIRPKLESLGFTSVRHVAMTLGVDPPPPGQPVEEISLEEVDSANVNIRADERPDPPDHAAALAEMTRRLHVAGHGRWFAVRGEDGGLVARAWLLRGDGIAQVEDVATAPSARGRGYASAVVSACMRAGLDSGADLVFVVADADETTPELYLKLGFKPRGITTRFVRKPPEDGQAEASP